MVGTISQKYAEFAYSLVLNDIPREVVEKAKLHILDTMGIMLATHDLEEVRKVVNVVKALGGVGESSVIGHGFKTPAPSASLANATMAHSVDYDDTHLGAIVHQSAVIVPTALAVGEKVNASGKEILEAIIAGYEVNARLGLVAPGLFHLRGIHPTSAIGVFGSAITAGKLLGLSVEELTSALGIAGSLSSGILQTIVEGVWVKPLHPAFASHAGILAALIAKEGIKGPLRIFEGEHGLFNSYLAGERFSLEKAVEGLGKYWETMNISIKPYPTCHESHSAIDIALILRSKYGITPDDVKEIVYYLPKVSIDLVAEPYEEKVRPRTPYGAKFSLPYIVIVALKKGWVGLWDFTAEAIRDEEVLRHTYKVRVIHEEKYDRYIKDGVGPARAKVVLNDGRVYEVEVIDHKGTPRNPMTKDDVIKKFMDNVSVTRYDKVSKEILDKVLNVERYSINEIMNILR